MRVVSATVVVGGGGSVGTCNTVSDLRRGETTKTSPTVGRKSCEEVYSVSAPGAGA